MTAVKLKKPHAPKDEWQSCSRRSPEAPQNSTPRLSTNPVKSGGSASAATNTPSALVNHVLTLDIRRPRRL